MTNRRDSTTSSEDQALHGIESCAPLLSNALRQAQPLDKKQRISAWKVQLAKSEKFAYQWLRDRNPEHEHDIAIPDGTYFSSFDRQLQDIKSAWLPICQKFANCFPDTPTFSESFVPLIRASPMMLRPMTGALLVETLRGTKASSASLDGWRPESLVVLSLCFPSLFHGLADILQWVEARSRWPSPLCHAYASLIPKPEMGEAHSPEQFRPIPFLSVIYRLWARTRFNDGLLWQEQWSPSEAWACRPVEGAETMCMHIAPRPEQCATHVLPCNIL